MVTCGTVESSATRGAPQRLPVDEEGKQSVMWWCRCTCCTEGGGGGGGGACLRPPSLALSLAKYLELRLHAPRYARAKSCHHSINQEHAHYFACGNTTACFRYSKIKSWDICLPPASIATHHNTKATRMCLINQVKDLVLKENEVFGNIGDGESDKEHALFKQHVEQIQLNLTSTSVQEQCTNAGVVRWLWSISDALIVGEKMLQDAHDKWTAQTSAKSGFKLPQDIVDGKVESDDSSQPDFHAVDCAADSRGLASSSSELDHTGEEEEDKGDKRGLRAMLSHLLNNSQPAHRNGVFLCDGVVPVVVMAGEVSSLVAAALASLQYHHLLITAPHTKGAASDTDEKENISSTTKEKSESDGKSKNAKNHEHIDVQLHKDGLSCRVFHALQFMKLRALLLCPLQCNTHIENDFTLKHDHGDSEIPSSDKNVDPPAEVNQKEIIIEHPPVLLNDKDVNIVENSPILGARRSVDKKPSLAKVGNDSLSEIEEAFIRSLSRCVPWAARGGKSGSTFCKTKDDRFILKEMSKMELQLFMDFAPSYFNYIQSCHQNNLPTLLGRIVGVYQVDGAGGVGNGVLVMENLWHGRTELARRFDLKGARRNRLADQGPPDVVLLDENLLNLRWDSPLYLQSHSAGVLWAAVKRDTDFLATHQIMDYSLLVGLDEERQELVLGIIDYIRTFTWDKKLEHIVKKGLGSGLPTIVSPDQYKARFCNAMRKYFLQSPNQWEDLDRGLMSDQKIFC